MRDYTGREKMTPREIEEFEQQKTLAQMQAEYQLKFKEMELSITKIETRWTQVFRLPFAVLTLPVRVLLVFGYIAHAIRGTQPPEKFWDYLTRV